MKDLVTRSVTGVFIVAIVILAIQLGPYSFFALCAVIGLMGLFELYRLFKITRATIPLAVAYFFGASLLSFIFLYHNFGVPAEVFLLGIPMINLILISSLFQRTEQPFHVIGIIFLGLLYVILPVTLFYSYPFVTDGTYKSELALGYFLMLWAGDSGAYLVGNLMGKHLLSSRISPKKTWEGSAGGAFMVVFVSLLDAYLFDEFSLPRWVTIGVLVIVFGTAGDLIKSAMKRSHNVKDCGTILPGHGGFLDRFDSLLGSIPAVYCYLLIVA